MRHDLGRDNVFFLHVSLVPYIGPSGELKTKPTQHSVAALRSIGIQPDAIVLRADRDVPDATKRKIALMCDVDVEGVVTAKDAPSIYDIPRVLHSEGLDAYVVQRLGLPFRDVEWKGWDDLLHRVHQPAHRVEVALVGKYIDLPDAYLSVTEALRAGGFHHDTKVVIRWVTSDDCQTPEGARLALEGVDAVLVPGGFGVRGIEGKLGALRWARENRIPTLGICLGLQCMVIEYARTVLGLEGASSSEFDDDPAHPVIATMAEQLAIVGGEGDLGGTMRLGAYEAALTPGSVVAEAYGSDPRHRAAPAPLRGQQLLPRQARGGRPGDLGRLARHVAGRVRRAAARRAPVLRGDAGAPRVQVAPDAGAPAVRGAHRGGSRPARRRVLMGACRWRDRSAAPTAVVLRARRASTAGKVFDLVARRGRPRRHAGAARVRRAPRRRRRHRARRRRPGAAALAVPAPGARPSSGSRPPACATSPDERARRRGRPRAGRGGRPAWPARGGGWSTSTRRRAGRTSGSGCSWLADLTAVADAERYTRTDEEAAMVPVWVPLDEAVDAALGGRLHSPTAVTGVLAAAAARARGWSTLEPVSRRPQRRCPTRRRPPGTLGERAASRAARASAAGGPRYCALASGTKITRMMIAIQISV